MVVRVSILRERRHGSIQRCGLKSIDSIYIGKNLIEVDYKGFYSKVFKIPKILSFIK
jgi:hypothetical protein